MDDAIVLSPTDFPAPEELEGGLPSPASGAVPSALNVGSDVGDGQGDEGYTSNTIVADEGVIQSKALSEDTLATDPDTSPRPVGLYTKKAGKVYFRNVVNGLDYVCSGAVVSSSSKRLVQTAGHCVHGGGSAGRWHANWMFCAGYQRGCTSYNKFTATNKRTYNDWINYGVSPRGYNSDVALVTTARNGINLTVEQRVGGFGLFIGGSYEFDAQVYGYPTASSGGEVQITCTTLTSKMRLGKLTNRYYFPRIDNCGMTGGASGGPWLYRYSSSTGYGQIRTISSFAEGTYTGGPYLDERFESLFRNAVADGI